MKKKSNITSATVIAMISTFTLIVWVGAEVYRSFTSEPETVVEEELLVPLSPTLDTTALSSLSSRLEVQEEFISQFSDAVGAQINTVPVGESTGESSLLELPNENEPGSTGSGQVKEGL